MKTIISTNWYRFNGLLVTEISGDIKMEDVMEWEQGFRNCLLKLADNTAFKILVNLHGFKAVNFEVHKRFRSVVPLTMADYGWRVGYVDMFDEATNLPVTTTRGIHCVAAAHVHQDASKMEYYETNYSRPNEHFFTDTERAFMWIRNFSPSSIPESRRSGAVQV